MVFITNVLWIPSIDNVAILFLPTYFHNFNPRTRRFLRLGANKTIASKIALKGRQYDRDFGIVNIRGKQWLQLDGKQAPTNGQFCWVKTSAINHSTQTNYDRPCTRSHIWNHHFVQTWNHKGNQTIGNHVAQHLHVTLLTIGLTHWNIYHQSSAKPSEIASS